MKTFVINLEKDIERRCEIINQCENFGLDYTVISAVNGRELSEDSLKKILHPVYSKGMTRGEIGCSLSHYSIYKKIVDENIDFALILEDDANLESKLLDAINLFEKNLPCNPTIVLLGPVNKHSKRGSVKLSEHFKYVSVFEAALSHGYIINKSAAERLIGFLHPIWLEADRWCFLSEYKIVDVKAITPPTITLSTLSTTSTIWPTEEELRLRKSIENERSLTLKKIKKDRNISMKIRLFLWRNITRKLIGVTSNDS